MTVIRMDRLTKYYGKVLALDDLTLDVNEGEVTGFIGPNGAGKSTTIRILLGLLRKTSGEVRVFGQDPWKEAVELHRRISYVPGDVNLWPGLTGGEAIDLLSRIRGDVDPKLRDKLIERFEFDPTKKCRTYSKGNRQKVALIAAFASSADLFILDEPTSGLDPLMEMVFQQCVAEVKAQGKSVLLSSHILAEVEKLCDRVAIIRDGKIVESGSLQELRHLTGTFISVVTGKPLTGLDQLPGVYDIAIDGDRAEFQVESAELGRVHTFLTQFDVRALTCAPPTLETLFMRHYGDAGSAGAAVAEDAEVAAQGGDKR